MLCNDIEYRTRCRRYQAYGTFRRHVKFKDEDPKWVEMPSVSDSASSSVEPGESYHDLGMRFPDAPIPRTRSDVIVHRATLEDVTGISQLMNWVSNGDIVIVEMTGLMSRDMELGLAVSKIQDFIEGDISGQLVRLGSSRLLLLPPSFEGVRMK
jgi:SepF-like predicted cell division protein (DUF552 family)